MPTSQPVSATESRTLPGHDLRHRVSVLGERLAAELRSVTEAIPGNPAGPQRLGKALGLDKVFASRLLKALRNQEPLAVVHDLPGPEPLRRFLVAAKKLGVSSELVVGARAVVEDFESLIRDEAGDRSALGAILSAWLPEVKAQLDVRARQAAYRALGQIMGAQAYFDHSTVLLSPGAEGRIDVVWIIGMVGLQRLHPGATVKFDTRRLVTETGKRKPTDLSGAELSGLGTGPADFCSGKPAPIDVHQVGEVVHYVLGDTGFGPRSAVDVLFCEVNRAELPSTVPSGSGRRAWFYADVKSVAKRMCFDIFVHRDVYPDQDPALLVYNTVPDGVADVNDPSREIDLLHTDALTQSLGSGLDRTPLAELPRYRELLEHVHGKLDWKPSEFRGYRTKIDYPIFGSQVTFAFRPATN